MKKLLFAFSFVVVLAAGLLHLVHNAKPALAGVTDCHAEANNGHPDYYRFPFGFFCPRNDGDNFSQARLNNSADTPNGTVSSNRSLSGAEAVAPGQTLHFETGYDKAGEVRTANPVDGASDSPPDNNEVPADNRVYVWTIVDGNNSIIDSVVNETTGSAMTNTVVWSQSCPTSAAPVNAYPGVDPDGSGPQDETSDYNRSPFAGGNLGGAVSCQSEGRMIIWRLTTANANSIGPSSLKFRVTLNSNFPEGQDKEVCLRTIVSVSTSNSADPEDPLDIAKLSHMAAKSQYRCYNVTATYVEGTVRSSESNATGKLLPQVTVYYDRNCDGMGQAGDKQTVTDANGKYVFNSHKGELYCLYTRGSSGGGADILSQNGLEESEGTRYRDPEGLYRGLGIPPQREGIQYQVSGVGCGDNAQGGNNDNNNYYRNCLGRTQDMTASYETEDSSNPNLRGHDFKFNPVPTAPLVVKSSWGEGTDENGNIITDPVLSQTLRPGDWVNFDVYIENGIDANQDVSFIDYIPLNIDPTTAVLECIQIDPMIHTYQPGTWEVVDAEADCRSEEDGSIVQGAYNSYIYYDTVINHLMSGRYIYTKSMGSGTERPQLTFRSERMPAYSAISFSWSGRVKDRNHIGVYPGGPTGTPGASDHRFCANPNGSTYNSSNRLITECEDTGAGYQGVANFAEAYASGNMIPYRSPVTYNPIPGNIKSISKLISSVTTFGGIPAYSLDPPYLNIGIFRSTIDPDDTMGPVRYQVIDQSNGAYNFAGSPLDIAIADVGTPNPGASLSNPTANSLGVLTWRDTGNADQMINSVQAGYRDFTFNARFDEDRPVGGIATNVSKICWPKYWEAGHGIDCRFSNQAQIRRIRIDKPTVAAEYGGVHGGGNIRITGGGDQTCSEIEGTLGILRANTGSYGLYMLSSKNSSNVNDFWSKSGFNVTNTSPGQGLKCRPDLAREAQNFATSGTAPSSISGTTPDDYKNKVMKTTGNVTIGDGGAVTTINGRWTLFVEGRVYIRGNIVRSGANALANSSSLGIIATDGIYIDKDVNRVDALLYAGGMRYSAGDTPTGNLYTGIIDTCARSESESLSTNFYNPANCRQQILTVSGIMNARNLKLNRTRVSVTENADKVVLPGHTYILAPPAFNLLFNQGSNYGYIREERPRF